MLPPDCNRHEGLVQITDSHLRYSFAAHSRTSLSSCITFSSTPRNLYCSPSSRHGILVDSTTLPPETPVTCTPLFTWATVHFFGFHWSPTSSIDDLTIFQLWSTELYAFLRQSRPHSNSASSCDSPAQLFYRSTSCSTASCIRTLLHTLH